MQTKLRERVPLRIYLQRLVQEIADREQIYSEESKIDPERYIRNEYKIIYK